MIFAQRICSAAAVFFALAAFSSASAADSAGIQAGTGQAASEHYGCDNPKAVEQYVLNLISDAKQKGISCESMQLHSSITSYCSGCGAHPELMSSCVKTGMEQIAVACSK
jgi:hypothetical protein